MPAPNHPRALPGQPNLRHLKLEAKRRLAAGEFPTLHDAQTAIAREHGLPTWTALKDQVSQSQSQGTHALDQLRWVISRFAAAEQPGWSAPADDELRQHFDDRFLSLVPPPTLIATLSRVAASLRGRRARRPAPDLAPGVRRAQRHAVHRGRRCRAAAPAHHLAGDPRRQPRPRPPDQPPRPGKRPRPGTCRGAANRRTVLRRPRPDRPADRRRLRLLQTWTNPTQGPTNPTQGEP